MQGELGWAACPTFKPLRAGPVGSGGVVWVATQLGFVYALNLSNNGTVVWGENLSTIPTQLDLAGSTLVLGDTVGTVYGLSAATGNPEWTQHVGSAVVQAPLDVNGTVYLATAAGRVVALNATTGTQAWSVSVGTGIGGALAEAAGTLYAVSPTGTLTALSLSGSVSWTAHVGGNVATAPAVGYGLVVIATLNGTVWAVSATGAHGLVWKWTVPANETSSVTIAATPALGDGLAVVQPESGAVFALNISSGLQLWYSGLPEFGNPSFTSPAVTPGVVYAVDDGGGELAAFDPSNGTLLWQLLLSFGGGIYTSPALIDGNVFVGSELGCLQEFTSAVHEQTWPVSGIVTNVTGAPFAGAVVIAGPAENLTPANGTFLLFLANGTYSLSATAAGYATSNRPLVVAGPIEGIQIVLRLPAYFLLAGRVLNAFTFAPVPAVSVLANSSSGVLSASVTTASGTFSFSVPNGTYNLSVPATGLYGAAATIVSVEGPLTPEVVLTVLPVGSQFPSEDGSHLVVWLPLGVAGLVCFGAYTYEIRRRRLAAGQSGRVLSPFGRYALMRALLVPAQASLLIAVIYVFDSLVANPQSLTFAQVVQGYATVWVDLFTGQWGTFTYHNVTAPTSQFFLWWLGPSLSLAVVAVVIAIALSYPLGIISGAGRSTTADGAVRVGSTMGLVIPAFLIALLVLLAFAQGFFNAFGDIPFGLLPTFTWFFLHQGGYPPWIGPVVNTSPTTIPVIDAAINGPWPVFLISLGKLGLQAFIIAVIFSAVYLRYVRSALIDAGKEPHLLGARSRGVSEGDITWHHLARRALPFYALVFAITLPLFIGVQAVVEYVFMDQGVGTLILQGLTSLAVPPGSPPAQPFDQVSLFQVSLFIVILAVLISVLAADIAARYFDPRLLRSER